MYNWIKNLLDAYDKMFVIEKPKKPTVYKIGNRRYIPFTDIHIETCTVFERTGHVRYPRHIPVTDVTVSICSIGLVTKPHTDCSLKI